MSHKETRDETLAMGDWALGFVVVGMLPIGLLTTELGHLPSMKHQRCFVRIRQHHSTTAERVDGRVSSSWQHLSIFEAFLVKQWNYH